MNLLADLLEQALAEPHSEKSWRDVLQAYVKAPDENFKVQAINRLISIAFSDSRAEMLRLTFLRDFQNDPVKGGLAAREAMKMVPQNPDRLASFASYGWAHAFHISEYRPQMIAALAAAIVPEIVEELTEQCLAQMRGKINPRSSQSIEKVAIIAQQLGGSAHTPSVAVLRNAEVLARSGLTVNIFSCQEASPPDRGRFFGSDAEVILDAFDVNFWQQMLPSGITLTCSDTRFRIAARWQEMLEKIGDFDPDVIFMCGTYSPISSALYSYRPVVAMNVHAFPPIVRADLWLTSNDRSASQEDLVWASGADYPEIFFHPYRIEKPKSMSAITRNALGIPEETVLWITVGARLQSEIRGSWAESVSEILQDDSSIMWLLVGGTGEVPHALGALPSDRIIALRHREDIADLLRISDIYVNPPRLGGGFSVAEAMAMGLPAVSMAHSDGGDKLGPFTVSSMDDYFDQLRLLSANGEVRRELGARLLLRFQEHFDIDKSGPSFIASFQRAAALAKERFANSNRDH